MSAFKETHFRPNEAVIVASQQQISVWSLPLLPLPPTHVCNSLIEDSISQIQDDHILIVVLLHTFRRNGKKHGKNRDPGVPKLY